MQRFILGVLAVALLGAAGSVYLIDLYIDKRIDSNSTAFNSGAATVQVLVAKKNLAIGKKVLRSDLLWQAWPKSGVQTGYVSATKPDNGKISQYLGKVTRRSILKGTPITSQSVFKKDRPGFLAGALDPNMRAMAVAISAKSGAAGFILPGDRVDVILTQDAKKKTRSISSRKGSPTKPKAFLTHIAETILKNIRVLAVDQKVDDFEKTAKVAKTVTLEVTQKQAEILAVSVSMGKLSLALRSLSDVANSDAVEASRKRAFSEALRAEKGPTKTTDLEVSPVLAATAGGVATDQENKDDIKKPRRVKVYRDGAPSMVKF